MENKEKQGIEIDLRRVLMALWSRAWIIILVGVIFALAGYTIAVSMIAPTYSANVKMYVNNSYNDNPGVSSSQITAAQNLAYTYMTILESRNVLDDVVAQTGLPYTANQIRSMIYSEALNGTEVFQVKVTCGNYKHAAILANAIADVLPGKVEQIVDGTSVRVVDRAVENPARVGPNYRRYGLVGGIAGILLIMLVIVVVDITDTTIVSEDYLTHVYSDTPLLVVIPGTENPKSPYYKGYKGYYKGYYQEEKPRQPRKGGGK